MENQTGEETGYDEADESEGIDWSFGADRLMENSINFSDIFY